MKKVIGDNFSIKEKYRMFRNVHDILHPTISKKNISNYKVVLDDKLLPILVFYPNKVSNLSSVIIYLPGDGNVSGSFGKYSDICMNMAKSTGKLVIALDYFGEEFKYPNTMNKCYKTIKYLVDVFYKYNINLGDITLVSDSIGCYIMSGLITKLAKNMLCPDKVIYFYPVVRDSYLNYKWNEACINLNYNLDKKVINYLDKINLKSNKKSFSLLNKKKFTNYPKFLILCGDVDIFKEDSELLFDKLSKNISDCSYYNVKYESHGFLGKVDEDINLEIYNEINKFIGEVK